jgi:hypothetical protein
MLQSVEANMDIDKIIPFEISPITVIIKRKVLNLH